MFFSFPQYKQLDKMDCGPTCLKIIAQYYGKNYPLAYFIKQFDITNKGVSLLALKTIAQEIGFQTLSVNVSIEKLNSIPLPCIAHWKNSHFVVIYKVTAQYISVSDPSRGLLKIPISDFVNGWCYDIQVKQGVLLVIEPTSEFYKQNVKKQFSHSNIKFLLPFITPHSKHFLTVSIGLITITIFNFITPFIPQALVDVGIKQKNFSFIYLLLSAQIVLFFGQVTVEFIRNWLLLYIGSKTNITLISSFLAKLLKLPIFFFESKNIGDILQRINDHNRIQSFLTHSFLTMVFSILNLFVFGIVLFVYNTNIFLVFFSGSLLGAIWIWLFLDKRRDNDHKRFAQLSKSSNVIIQLIAGIQEVKINGVEKQKKREWRDVQEKLFNLNINTLKIEQYQQAGSTFITQIKNTIIIFLAAKGVIDGNISLGVMLSISYIIGQLNIPAEQLINFIHQAQDTKISLKRVQEIHEEVNEEDEFLKKEVLPTLSNYKIVITGLSFKYKKNTDYTLKNINLSIDQGKTIAVIGASGSGKTTLLKLLLRFYSPNIGKIEIGTQNIENLSHRFWRAKCGAVMQNGYIFNDTILYNITLSNNVVNKEKFLNAVNIANLNNFLKSLPECEYTKIGVEQHNFSEGQKQRILIARAIYKDPEILFFDEATSSLDVKNETIIMNKLRNYCSNKTMFIIAHRLSTVRNADKIIVLDNGVIAESGNHLELTKLRGIYYDLIKDQLELNT